MGNTTSSKIIWGGWGMSDTNQRQVPRWLEIQAEMDFIAWQIEEMYRTVGRRSPLDVMIDKATGYDATLTAEATELVARFRELRTEYERLAPA